jgi:Icc-related predicted phosphoesterase
MEDSKVLESLAIISDVHGDYKTVGKFMPFFEMEGITKALVPGDICYNKNLRFPYFYKQQSPKELENEIINVIDIIADRFELVAYIPGNHEIRDAYEPATKKISKMFDNAVDMLKERVIETDHSVIVSLPGFYDKKRLVGYSKEEYKKVIEYINLQKSKGHILEYPPRLWYLKLLQEGGYLISDDDIRELPALMERYLSPDKIGIVMSHGLPLTPGGRGGPDDFLGYGNMGSEVFNEVVQDCEDISVVVGGHAHSGGWKSNQQKLSTY